MGNRRPYRFSAILECPAGPAVLVILETCISTIVNRSEQLETSFLTAASAFDVKHDMSDRRQQACPFPAGVVTLVSGEVDLCELISSNLNQPFMPMWLDLTTVPVGSNARLFRYERSPL